MARIARVVLPGHPHHVTQKGVRSLRVFRDHGDRHKYLSLVAEQGGRFGLSFLAYCLMDNHIHLIVVPRSADSLARGIGEAHRRSTGWVNHGENIAGYLFQGRFYSCPLDERHLVAAARYIERNPVRAGLVREAWNYEWSSAAYHIGLRTEDPLVKDCSLLGLAIDWQEMLLWDPEEMPTLRCRTRTGRPCGDGDFLEAAERLTRRRLRPKPMGRPYRKSASKLGT